MGPVNFILESKASALGINTTVISKTANDKKISMREQVCNLYAGTGLQPVPERFGWAIFKL
jgi:hypothetical protein